MSLFAWDIAWGWGAERLSSMRKTFASLSRTGKTKEVDRSDLRVINCLKMSSASFKLSVGISFSMPLPPYFGRNPVFLGLNYLPGLWKWKLLEARNFIILLFSQVLTQSFVKIQRLKYFQWYHYKARVVSLYKYLLGHIYFLLHVISNYVYFPELIY